MSRYRIDWLHDDEPLMVAYVTSRQALLEKLGQITSQIGVVYVSIRAEAHDTSSQRTGRLSLSV